MIYIKYMADAYPIFTPKSYANLAQQKGVNEMNAQTRCPSPPGTILRLNLGPVELDLLGLQVAIPSGLCLIVRAGTLPPLVQRQLARRLKKQGGKLIIRGTLNNDGRSKSRLRVRQK